MCWIKLIILELKIRKNLSCISAQLFMGRRAKITDTYIQVYVHIYTYVY